MLHKVSPFININFSQPTAAAALMIDPKFPGSLMLSQMIVSGNELLAGFLLDTSGVLKIPTSKDTSNIDTLI